MIGALLLTFARKAGERVNDTDELIWELQDQVQRVERKVNRLLADRGIDPEEAGSLPAEQEERKAA